MTIYNIDDTKGLPPISDAGWHTVVTVGMFDGVHVGHQHIVSVLANTARQLGLRPLVVTFDQHPREVLSTDGTPFPRITTNEERYARLEACGVEELVELHFTAAMAELSACQFLEQLLVGQLHAEALVLGYDNMFGNKRHNDFGLLHAEASRLGVRLFEAGPVEVRGSAVSSTRIRQALRDGHVDEATTLLGTPYSITGLVEQGFHIGRTLGFPTANITLPESSSTGTAHKLLPADGVYAVRVLDNGSSTADGSFTGIANLGTRPTFGREERTLEVHLIDRQADLYGHSLTVQFIHRLRDIRKFGSPEGLASQLVTDREQALRIFADPQ